MEKGKTDGGREESDRGTGPLGVTPAEETVTGDARLALDNATLHGQLDFTGLARRGERAAGVAASLSGGFAHRPRAPGRAGGARGGRPGHAVLTLLTAPP